MDVDGRGERESDMGNGETTLFFFVSVCLVEARLCLGIALGVRTRVKNERSYNAETRAQGESVTEGGQAKRSRLARWTWVWWAGRNYRISSSAETLATRRETQG